MSKIVKSVGKVIGKQLEFSAPIVGGIFGGAPGAALGGALGNFAGNVLNGDSSDELFNGTVNSAIQGGISGAALQGAGGIDSLLSAAGLAGGTVPVGNSAGIGGLGSYGLGRGATDGLATSGQGLFNDIFSVGGNDLLNQAISKGSDLFKNSDGGFSFNGKLGRASGNSLSDLFQSINAQDILVGGGQAASTYLAYEAAKDAARAQENAINEGIGLVDQGVTQGRNAITDALNDSNALLAGQTPVVNQGYGQAIDYQQPYYDAGVGAQNQLSRLLGLNGQQPDYSVLTSNPAYQFRQQQGQQAVENSAANRGGLFSGQTGRDLTEYSQGVASQEYNNILSQLTGQATRGQQAGNTLSNLATGKSRALNDVTTRRAQNRTTAGTNLANLATGRGNAISDLVRSRGDAVAGGQLGASQAVQQGIGGLTSYLTRPEPRKF